MAAIPAVVPIQFTVDAVTLFLSTVSPDPLVEGQTATLTGTGFDPTPTNNTVTMDGVSATVTAATATQLDVVVPAFDCMPARDVSVEVTVAAVTTNTVTRAAEPASFLTVAVGQQLLITEPASFCLQFAASAANEAYLIGVQSILEVPLALTDVRLVAAKDPAAPAPPLTPPTRVTAQGFSRDFVITDRMRRWNAHREAHASFCAFTSLIAQVEVMVRAFVDAGVNRVKAIKIVGIATFVLGVPSAISMNVLNNQDWVWGVALMLAGLFFCISVIPYGVKKFREEQMNHEDSNIRIGVWWDIVIKFFAPVQMAFLLVWFMIQSYRDNPVGWLAFYDKDNISNVGAVVWQFAIVLVGLIALNKWIVKKTLNDDGTLTDGEGNEGK